MNRCRPAEHAETTLIDCLVDCCEDQEIRLTKAQTSRKFERQRTKADREGLAKVLSSRLKVSSKGGNGSETINRNIHDELDP